MSQKLCLDLNLLGHVSGSDNDHDNIMQQENIGLSVQGHGKSLSTFIYVNIANFYCTKILNYLHGFFCLPQDAIPDLNAGVHQFGRVE